VIVSRQQKRAEREGFIIRQAISLFVKKGFLGVRMMEIAKASELSMGTIYSHFATKEDLLLACATRMIREEKEIHQAIIASNASAMRRIVTCFTVNWLIARQHPGFVEIENLSLMPSVWTRAHPQRIQELNALHGDFFDMINSVILEMLNGDLHGYTGIDDVARQELARLLNHGMWGLCVGLNSTAQSGLIRAGGGHQDTCSYKHFTTNVIHFLKGYGWTEAKPEMVFKACREQARTYLLNHPWFACLDTMTDA